MSDTAAAALANGLLKDLNNITNEDRDEVVDAAKIRRERNRVCRQIIHEHDSLEKFKCIGLDGKRDRGSLIYAEIIDSSGQSHREKSKAEIDHYTFTIESGPRKGEYLTHIGLKDPPTGLNIGKASYDVLERHNSVDSLEAVLVDNTVANTGFKGGAVSSLEKLIGRRLHLIGCALHMNELPLRKLYQELGGGLKSGKVLTGPIGKAIQTDIWRQNEVNFEPVPSGIGSIPENVIDDLSTDQRLLLEYSRGVAEGKISTRFVHHRIGPFCQSRWLTFAIRILALYTRTNAPNKTLKTLVIFIQRIYSKYWFEYKKAKSFLDGPKILHGMISDIKSLNFESELHTSLMKTVQRNAFCCLSENFLASMMFSDNENHRTIALERIKSISDSQCYGFFSEREKIPLINTSASYWIDLIDLNECKVIPPCLINWIKHGMQNLQNLQPPDFPIHSQSVERAVQLTSVAVKKSFSLEKQRMSIVSKNKCRQLRPKFKSKSCYMFCMF